MTQVFRSHTTCCVSALTRNKQPAKFANAGKGKFLLEFCWLNTFYDAMIFTMWNKRVCGTAQEWVQSTSQPAVGEGQYVNNSFKRTKKKSNMSFWSYGVHPTMNEHTAVTMGGMRRGDLRHTSTPNNGPSAWGRFAFQRGPQNYKPHEKFTHYWLYLKHLFHWLKKERLKFKRRYSPKAIKLL